MTKKANEFDCMITYEQQIRNAGDIIKKWQDNENISPIASSKLDELVKALGLEIGCQRPVFSYLAERIMEGLDE